MCGEGLLLLTTCYVCAGNLIPQEQIGLYICAICGKEWRQMLINPTPDMQVYIPGAKHAMGGKSSRKKRGKELLQKPTQKKLFERLYGNW